MFLRVVAPVTAPLCSGSLIVKGDPSALAFGSVHRHVGLEQQVGRVACAGDIDDNPNAGVDHYQALADLAGRSHGIVQFHPQAQNLLERLNAFDQARKFVSPESADQIPGAYRVCQPARNNLQQGVASSVPVGVIDWLEAVQVEVHDGKAVAGQRMQCQCMA
jgi:hypothetical protein